MKKKMITIFMASMLAVTSLAGCTSSENEKSGESGAKEESKSEEGDREITIWCWDTSDNGKKMNAGFTEK